MLRPRALSALQHAPHNIFYDTQIGADAFLRLCGYGDGLLFWVELG